MNVVIKTAYLFGRRARACEGHHRVMAKQPGVDGNNAMGRGFLPVSTLGAGRLDQFTTRPGRIDPEVA